MSDDFLIDEVAKYLVEGIHADDPFSRALHEGKWDRWHDDSWVRQTYRERARVIIGMVRKDADDVVWMELATARVADARDLMCVE